MRTKVVVISVMAMVGVAVLALASAVTVFAVMSQTSTVEEAQQAAPVQIEVEQQPVVVQPVIHTEKAEYAGKSGCPYQEAKMQQVHAEPVETIEDNLLTQAAP